MRLLNVIASTNPEHGGVIEWVRQFGLSATEMGHTIDVASMDPPDAGWLAEFPLNVYPFGQKFNNFYSPGLVKWLRNVSHNYDAVIAHGLWRFPSFATWLALHKRDTPYFVYTHGMLDPWFKHSYPLKHAAKWLYWPWTDYRVLRDASGVIFTCEQEKLKARESFWLYKARELVATIGITAPGGDPDEQRKLFYETYPELQNKRILLFLGRIHPKKGCDLLIKAFANAAHDAADLHLVMAGPDKTSWIPTLKGLVNDKAISGRISWVGMIDGDLKWGAFRAADAFILPSHQENFGISVVEAMACQTPVLITDKVDIFTEVDKDHAGLVETDTQEAVDRLVRQWVDTSSGERKKMGISALQCFKKRFEVTQATSGVINQIWQAKENV